LIAPRLKHFAFDAAFATLFFVQQIQSDVA